MKDPLYITAKQIATMTGKSIRHAQMLMHVICEALNKKNPQFITVQEYADYTGTSVEQVRPYCK